MKRILLTIAIAASVAACSDTEDTNSHNSSSSAGNPFPTLPSSSLESAVLEGKMTFWMYEGDAGCYGSIFDGNAEVQLWVDATTCGDTDYAENAEARVEVTFNPDNQYGPGKTFTIKSFL